MSMNSKERTFVSQLLSLRVDWAVYLATLQLFCLHQAVLAQSSSTLVASLHLDDRIQPAAKLVGFQDDQWQFNPVAEQAEQADSAGNARVWTRPLRWGQWRGIVGRQAVWMSDDSWLVGSIEFADAGYLRLEHRWLQIPSIPLKSIRGLIYTPSASIYDWLELKNEMQSVSGENDVVWLRGRNQLAGVIDLQSLSPTSSRIKMRVDGETVDLPIEDLVALVFSPILNVRTTIQPKARIGLEDGTLLCISQLRSFQDRFQCELPSVTVVSSLDTSRQFLNAVTYLQYSAPSSVQRLDGLDFAAYRHLSENSLQFDLGVNQDVFGQPLMLGKRRNFGIVHHGLAIHSTAQAAYRWDQSPAKFLAEVRLSVEDGIQNEGQVPREVKCKILLARGGKLETAMEFNLVQHATALQGLDVEHQMVDVDVSGAQLIALVVESGRFGNYGGHTLWLDSRITRVGKK